MIALGYQSIFLISFYRISLYLEENPKERGASFIYYGDELEKDPRTKTVPERETETLCRYIAYNYMGKEEGDIEIGELFLLINEYFGEDPLDNMIMVAKGNKLLKNVTTWATLDLIDEYRNEKRRYNYENDKKIENLINSEKLSNPSELQEAEVLPNLRSIQDWIDDKIPDPINRQILNYRYFDKLTLRKIGEKVGMSAVAVKKRLDKLNPPF